MDLKSALENAGLAEDQIAAVLANFPPPDVGNWNPDTDHLRGLLERAGLSQREAGRLLGIGQSRFRGYMRGIEDCPYPIQYCLEILAELNNTEKGPKTQSGEDHDR